MRRARSSAVDAARGAAISSTGRSAARAMTAPPAAASPTPSGIRISSVSSSGRSARSVRRSDMPTWIDLGDAAVARASAG